MYFTKIELHNFGIYKGTHEMSLSDGIGSRNVTLVGGLNGRGKTTFHDAILLALYGKQASKYIQERSKSFEKLLIEHINKHATDNETYIAVSLHLDDGTCLRVKRSWQLKTGRTDTAKIEHQVVVEKNGVEDKLLGDSWNYYIEEILPFGIARFFFFNNEKITQLADDASFEQIKDSIKSAIGVSVIEKAIAHADEVIRRKKNDLKSFEQSEENVAYKAVETQIAEIDGRIASTTEQLHEIERKCESLAVKLEIKEEEFWSSGGDLSRNRDAIKSEMQRISAEMENAQSEIVQVTADAAIPLYMCRGLVQESHEKALRYQESEAILYSRQVVQELRDKLIRRLQECKLDRTSIEVVSGIVDDVLAKNFDQLESDNARNPVSGTSMMLYKHLLTEVFQGIEERISALISSVDAQENKLLSLDAYLSAEDEKNIAMKLYEALKEIESEKAVADADYQRLKDSIASMNRQREMLVARRIQLIRTIAERQHANDDNARIMKYAAMSIQTLTEFKQRLQSEKLEKLSGVATVCFQRLVEKESLVSEIKIDPSSLDVTIFDIEGRELLKNQLSAGEQQMFAISIVWALALTSGYKAPVVIDTPMARLDSSHRENFVTKYLPSASSQVIVLSTDEEIYGHYLDILRENVLDYYTLLYREDEQCTSIVQGYFSEA